MQLQIKLVGQSYLKLRNASSSKTSKYEPPNLDHFHCLLVQEQRAHRSIYGLFKISCHPL